MLKVNTVLPFPADVYKRNLAEWQTMLILMKLVEFDQGLHCLFKHACQNI